MTAILDTELRVVLGRELRRSRADVAVLAVRRAESRYRSSYPLEELLVQTTHGQLEMIWKRVAPHELSEAARAAKPAFLVDPRREIDAYRNLLAPLGVGPRLYGADTTRGWLFLARVPGIELYQIGHPPVWQQVAAWLAGMHHQFARVPGAGHAPSRVVRYDRQFYRRFMERALARDWPGRAGTAIRRLSSVHHDLVDRLVELPATILHGEFYASNVLVDPASERVAVWPVDWEMAAVGPALFDLAALVAGRWSSGQRALIADAYRHAGTDGIDRRTFRDALACCRLQLCIQWLGWSDSWTPPPQHAHDWLAEACELLEEIAW
jgi:aminoglycoside/choline kinase family phosphotransferase